jgi:environmental stress-induced protein Ves
MEFTIKTSANFQTVKWQGGTTTELFIFPKEADYKLRNFKFRLSTATVETDRSDFTILNGISRKLMVLAGKISLSHEDHYSRQLNKFDVDEFDGGWKTSSSGRCIDFNLMTTGKTSGELTAIVIDKEQHAKFKTKEHCDWIFVYVFSGNVRIEINYEVTDVRKGDLLVLNKQAIRNFEIIGIENSELVVSEVTV